MLQEPSVLAQFCSSFLELEPKELLDITVETQYRIGQLTDHKVGSRPDIALFFKDGRTRYAVFVESKLQSIEQLDQLWRYAEHLDKLVRHGETDKSTLVYITERAERKDVKDILSDSNSTLFYQLRWQDIYKWVAETPHCFAPYLSEYMEGSIMPKVNHFDPELVAGLQGVFRLLPILEECLGGPTTEGLKKFGNPTTKQAIASQILDKGRYMKVVNMAEGKLWIGCGFYPGEDGFPLVTVQFEVGPDIEDFRGEIITAMTEFIDTHEEWQGYDLELPRSWANIRHQVPIQHFLGKNDHVSGIQQFFVKNLELLNANLKQTNLDFPW